jgi:hypothetical protein
MIAVPFMRHSPVPNLAPSLAAGLLLAAAAFPPTAPARGFIAFHFGVPLVAGPPVYYVPPPAVYYTPPPVYYVAPPAPVPAVATTSGTSLPSKRQRRPPCREYRTAVTIDGKEHSIVGTACLEPDGTWRINPP